MSRLNLKSYFIVLLVFGFGLFLTTEAVAESDFFSSRCAECHNDDTPTCAGCHMHRGTVSAAADNDIYDPEESMVVMLTRIGGRSGWVRGLLYDHNNSIIAIATGPTGAGDDSLGDPVTFPITFDVTAPLEEGEYTWRAAYFGSNNAGSSHYEQSHNIVFEVVDSQDISQWWLEENLDDAMHVSVFPNPVSGAGVFKFSLGAHADQEATLSLVDATGRLVRRIGENRFAEGVQQLRWDGTDQNGRQVESGVYMAILSSGKEHVTRPVLVLR
jgi:FlgD Ig-like domain